MGIVVLRSTTPWVVLSSLNSADFVTLNSIASYSSRAVPGAVIVTLPSVRAGTRPILLEIHRCRTVLAFCQSIKSAYRLPIVEISGKRTFSPFQIEMEFSHPKVTTTITRREVSNFGNP